MPVISEVESLKELERLGEIELNGFSFEFDTGQEYWETTHYDGFITKRLIWTT